MIPPLILLVSLVGILWIGMGRPKIGHGTHSECKHHSGSLGRKAVGVGAVALGLFWFAHHALVILGLSMVFLLFVTYLIVAIVRRRRRRLQRHLPTSGYFR